MRKSLLAVTLLLSLTLTAQNKAKDLKASNGVTIGFYEYKPSDYDDDTKYPVIIFLHGIGERGNGKSQLSKVEKVGIAKMIKNGHKMRFTRNGKTETFIVLSPQLSSKYGSWPDFYVAEMIKYAKKNLSIDENRIYLTGLSLGGGGVWSFASSSISNARQLAAIAPICGTCQMKNGGNIAKADLPVWAFHAKNDGVVSVSCTYSAVKKIRENNPKIDPIETIWSSGNHGIWDRVYEPNSGYNDDLNIYEWFLGQSRNGSDNSNKKPVANAGSDFTVSSDKEEITLDGSKSNDPDGRIVKYSWKQVSGPSKGKFKNEDEAKAEVSDLKKAGKYEFELKVEDNDENESTATVTITVEENPKENKRPEAKAGKDIELTLPNNSAKLNGKESKDPDGSIKKYNWKKIDGPSKYKIVSSDDAETTVEDLVEGEYTFLLTVTDNNDESESDEIEITVNAASRDDDDDDDDSAPIANAGEDESISLPANQVILDGNGSKDEDGSISYSWSQVRGPANARIYNPKGKSTSARDLTEGEYTFQLKVTNKKKKSSTDEVIITVKAASAAKNKAPTARAGDDEVITLPTDQVIFNGNRSEDEDGTIKSYSWKQISGPSQAFIFNPEASATSMRNLGVGVYSFRLTVTDNKGETSSDDVKVTVKPGKDGKPDESKEPDESNETGGSGRNQAPVSRAGADRTISLPKDSVILDGRLSTDDSGPIKSYSWSQESGPSTARIFNDRDFATSMRNLEVGIYVFRLTVRDNQGASGFDEVTVIVKGSSSNRSISKVQTVANDFKEQSIIVNEKLGVYPNPARENINVQLATNTQGATIFNIYDVSGKTVKRIAFQKTQATLQQNINISSLKSGIYHLEVVIDNKTKLVSKFIKQ